MTRTRISLVVLLVVVATTAPLLGPTRDTAAAGPVAGSGTSQPATASEDTADPASGPVRRAHTRLTMYTTSGWTKISLGGVTAGHLTVSDNGNRHVQPAVDGVTVTGTGGSLGYVEVDVVVETPSDVDHVDVSLRQSPVGATTTWVQNLTEEPRVLTMVTTDETTTSDTERVAADTFFGPTDYQLDHLVEEEDRQVLAFAYPWFNESSTTDPELSVHPTQPMLSGQRASAVEAAETARAHGVDGFVLSFAGGAEDGIDLHQALEAGADTDGTATVLVEAEQADGPEQVERWIREALRQSDHPAFLRHDGVPVVFVYGGFTLAPDALDTIADRMAAEGTPVQFVTDAHGARRSGILGAYRYEVLLRFEQSEERLLRMNLGSELFVRAGATLRGEDPGLLVATAQPGYDDQALRGDQNPVVERHGTETYDMTWRSALAAQPDWVVVTSWNEWYEGTSIAPSVEYGDTALEATAGWAPRLPGA